MPSAHPASRTLALVPLLALLVELGCNGNTPVDSGAAALLLGADPAVRAGADEARAGVVREGPSGEAALFGGVNAEGSAGDIKLYNSEVQFILQGVGRSHGLVDVSGGIIDADQVRADGVLGRDLVEDLFLAFGFSRVFEASEVVLVSDGSDGGDAIVEARGTDVPWDYFLGLLERDEPVLGDLHLDITRTYRLAPGALQVEVTTTLLNTSAESVTVEASDGIFLSGEETLPWAAGPGFGDKPSGAVDALVWTGRHGEGVVSVWRGDAAFTQGGLGVLTEELGITLAEHPDVTLEGGESTSFTHYVSVAADAGRAEASRRRLAGESLKTLSGVVSDPSGGIPGARVHVVNDADEVVAVAHTRADGAYAVELPSGSYDIYAVAQPDFEQVPLPDGAGRMGPFTAASINASHLDVLSGSVAGVGIPWAQGHAPSAAVVVSLGEDAVADVVLDAPGRIRVALSDDAGGRLPGMVDLQWASDGQPELRVPEALHEALGIRGGGGRAAWGWTATGELELAVLPGTYSLSASHSWRYEQASATDITVGAGEVVEVSLTLDEVVARDGWLSVDPHLHAAPSFDGALPMEDRLITCAAAGVDMPVSTDHDALTDYRPLNTALGLDERMRVMPGLEVTSLLRGHFNLYPIEPKPVTEPNGGAVAWWLPFDTTDELVQRMRAAGQDNTMVQVNHPRLPGMFSLGDLDPNTCESDSPDQFSWNFELFELVNGADDDVGRVRKDWFNFLSTDRRFVPTGASDSHYRYITCGLGRTDVFLGSESPADVSIADVRDALARGQVVVASGTTLRVSMENSGGQALPGGTLVGASATLSATVRAPSWIHPGTLRVYENGEVIHTVELTEASADGLWLDTSWEVTPARDAWYVVEVEGVDGQGSLWRGRPPYAAANAIFVDVLGDGWDAPGL